MALPATDTYTGATDGQNLTAYSANWTIGAGAFQCRSDGTVQTNNGLDCYAYWNADTFNANHSSSTTIAVSGSPSGDSKGVGPACRCTASGSYTLEASMATVWLATVDSAQNWTELGSNAVSTANNDVFLLEANGTTLTPKRNGTTLSMGAVTNSTYSSGGAGISGYGGYVSTNYHAVTSWTGDNLGGGGATSLVAHRAGRRMYSSLLTW